MLKYFDHFSTVLRVGSQRVILPLMVLVAMGVLSVATSAEEEGWLQPPAMTKQDFQQLADELATLRAEEEALLNSYEWIDKEAGKVRIPIERAMQLLVERGLPNRSDDPPAPEEPEPESAVQPDEAAQVKSATVETPATSEVEPAPELEAPAAAVAPSESAVQVEPHVSPQE